MGEVKSGTDKSPQMLIGSIERIACASLVGMVANLIIRTQKRDAAIHLKDIPGSLPRTFGTILLIMNISQQFLIPFLLQFLKGLHGADIFHQTVGKEQHGSPDAVTGRGKIGLLMVVDMQGVSSAFSRLLHSQCQHISIKTIQSSSHSAVGHFHFSYDGGIRGNGIAFLINHHLIGRTLGIGSHQIGCNFRIHRATGQADSKG